MILLVRWFTRLTLKSCKKNIGEGTSQPKDYTENNIDCQSKQQEQSSGVDNNAEINPHPPAMVSGGLTSGDHDISDMQFEHIDNNNIAPVLSSDESEVDRKEYGVAGKCQGCDRVFDLSKAKSNLYRCKFCESFTFCCVCNMKHFHSHHEKYVERMRFSEYDVLLNG